MGARLPPDAASNHASSRDSIHQNRFLSAHPVPFFGDLSNAATTRVDSSRTSLEVSSTSLDGFVDIDSSFSSDVIGFHIYDYARHFKSSCTRILGLDCTPLGVEVGSGFSVVGTFPIGIDPKRFSNALKTEAVQQHIKELKEQFEGRRIIVGIDRLDYIKGIPHKLFALERFLTESPQWYV